MRFALYFILAVLIAGCVAHWCVATAPVNVSFQQTSDCSLVDHWVIYAAPGDVAAGSPNAVQIGTVSNSGGTSCSGQSIITVPETAVGAGMMTFWMVAVAADGTTSAPSNTVVVSVPLAPPIIVNVVVQ